MMRRRRLKECPIEFKLIARVKKSPVVYNRKREIDSNKKKEWEEIGRDTGVDAKTATIRFKTMRDRYVRQLKEHLLNPGKTEPSAFFQQMDFLRPFIQSDWRRRNVMKSISGADSDSSTSKLITISDSDEEEENSLGEDVTRGEENSLGEDDTRGEENRLDEDDHSKLTEDTYDEDVDVDSVYGVTNYSEEASNESETPQETEPPEDPEKPPLIISDEFLSSPATTPTDEFQFTLNSGQQQQQLQQRENGDDFFCKTVAVYLRQLRRRYKIKAEVEILQILQKYLDLEESDADSTQTMSDSSAMQRIS